MEENYTLENMVQFLTVSLTGSETFPQKLTQGGKTINPKAFYLVTGPKQNQISLYLGEMMISNGAVEAEIDTIREDMAKIPQWKEA